MLEEEAALLTQVFARGARNDSFLVLVTLERGRQREKLSRGSSPFIQRSPTDRGTFPQLMLCGTPSARTGGMQAPPQPPMLWPALLPSPAVPKLLKPHSCSRAGASTLVFQFTVNKLCPAQIINATASPVSPFPLSSCESLMQEKNTP